MQIGIIGYGGFGRFLHSAWQEVPGVTVAAVADAAASLPEHVRAYRSAEALLADDRVELVSICTPPATHADLACRAMEAGKHVLVEKPLATTRADADRMLETRRRTGTAAGINYVMRYTPIAERLLAWSQEAPFGPLRRVTVENEAQDEALPAEHWFWDPAVSGGILVEHAVHFIDLIDACAGRGEADVSGTALRRPDGRVDRMLLHARYGQELLVTQYHAFTRPRAFERTRWAFRFDALEIELDGWIPLSGTVRALVDAAGLREIEQLPGFRRTRYEPLGGRAVVAGRAYPATHLVEGSFAVAESKDAIYRRAVQEVLRDVIRSAREPGHQPRVSLAEARRSLEMALRASESA